MVSVAIRDVVNSKSSLDHSSGRCRGALWLAEALMKRSHLRQQGLRKVVAVASEDDSEPEIKV